MAIALLTTYLSDYRMPLFERLAERHNTEVLCYGGGERYAPEWFTDLETQLRNAPFPARRITGPREAFAEARRYDAVIAPFAGGAILPAAYAGAKLAGKPFILWASVWVTPRSAAHAIARPVTRHIYRHADAILAYGEHVRRYVARIRGRDEDVFVVPQAVEPELFARQIPQAEIDEFRKQHDLGPHTPLVLFAGRLEAVKGVDVLLEAWRRLAGEQATLVLAGSGPLSEQAKATPQARFIGPIPRTSLPVAYAAAELTVVPSVPSKRFVEPWGLVCNEAMHQGRPVVATSTVGAVAGGLVQHERNGLVVAAGDPDALGAAIRRLLGGPELRARLGAAARSDVATYTYDEGVAAFDRALSRSLPD
jgi:glycosyltransferase involved in cell wall biosynthesis